jgi:soluble lytic murein transglycosylase-like protein
MEALREAEERRAAEALREAEERRAAEALREAEERSAARARLPQGPTEVVAAHSEPSPESQPPQASTPSAAPTPVDSPENTQLEHTLLGIQAFEITVEPLQAERAQPTQPPLTEQRSPAEPQSAEPQPAEPPRTEQTNIEQTPPLESEPSIERLLEFESAPSTEPLLELEPPPSTEPLPSMERIASEPDFEETSRLDTLLGLRAFGGVAKKPGPPPERLPDAVHPIPRSSRPPPLPAGFTEIAPAAGHSGMSQALARDLDLRLERQRRAEQAGVGLLGPSSEPLPLEGTEPKIPFEHTLTRFSGLRWPRPFVVGGLVAALTLVAIALGTTRRETVSALHTAVAPRPWLSPENEALRQVLAEAHAGGGRESPELADAIDEEAALFGQALTEPCIPGSRPCQLVEQARSLLAAPAPLTSRASAASPSAPWLSGLALPAIGVEDEARVREIVEFHTEQTLGREAFQVRLFQCGFYEDLFRQALRRNGLPLDLMALAMVGSGCAPDMESPTGARGLWRLMPPTARAYHLRVQPGVMDERISPRKSTQAAAQLLSDLKRKLGSWELVIASYDLGPFSLLARLRQTDGSWDWPALVASGRLPAETVAFVSKIQAFALILANLAQFRFEPAQPPEPEPTVDLDVPAGTRLGVVARAASSSTSKIRELNPDVIGDRVPNITGESFVLRVPREGGARARATLDQLLLSEDHADQCVPHSFDWGRQRLTRSMATRCEQARAHLP